MLHNYDHAARYTYSTYCKRFVQKFQILISLTQPDTKWLYASSPLWVLNYSMVEKLVFSTKYNMRSHEDTFRSRKGCCWSHPKRIYTTNKRYLLFIMTLGLTSLGPWAYSESLLCAFSISCMTKLEPEHQNGILQLWITCWKCFPIDCKINNFSLCLFICF